MYSAKSHLEDVVDFFKPCITECKIIDGGMIQLLQFIDTHIKKPFKHILRERERDGQIGLQMELKSSANKTTVGLTLFFIKLFQQKLS